MTTSSPSTTTSRSSESSCRPSPWDQLLQEVSERWPIDRWGDLGVVIGCSGGADSVALVAALATLQARRACASRSKSHQGFLVVAHFHHRLRGADADADQQLAHDLSRRLGLRWETGYSETSASDEASMRASRLQFLIDTAHATGSRYVALAHSADDNVETFLHHLMRGTGPAGLSGMGSPRPIDEDLVLVRPLLQTRRELIRSALVAQRIDWREDISNLDPTYRRNWIRHQLIPLIESQYPQGVDAIERAIDGQRQWRGTIDRLADAWLDESLVRQHPPALRRDHQLDSAIAIAAAQRIWDRNGWPRGGMTQAHWLRLADTLRGNAPDRYALPGSVDVTADDGQVQLSRNVDG